MGVTVADIRKFQMIFKHRRRRGRRVAAPFVLEQNYTEATGIPVSGWLTERSQSRIVQSWLRVASHLPQREKARLDT